MKFYVDSDLPATSLEPVTAVAVIEGAHSPLGPSGAERWMNCAGSRNLIERLGLVSEDNIYSIWGTKVHDIAKALLTWIAAHQLPGEAKFDWDAQFKKHEITPGPGDMNGDEVKEVLEFYVNGIFTQGCEHVEQWTMWVEYKFKLPSILRDVWGTGDCIVYCPVCRWLRTIDLKTGRGVVAAAHNKQLRIYALLALFQFALPVKKLTIEISQPRGSDGADHLIWPAPEEPILTPLDLLEWLPTVQAAATATEDPNAPLTAGAHCKKTYCPALAVCPAARAQVAQAAILAASNKAMTPEGLAEALQLLPVLKGFIEAVNSFAYEQAKKGLKIPGKKLVKVNTHRKYRDESVAEDKLAVFMANQLNARDAVKWEAARAAVMEDPKLRSPAKMEDVLKKYVGAKAAKEFLKELCYQPEGGTVLADESDSRKAVSLADKAEDMFPANIGEQPTVTLLTPGADTL